MLFGSPLPPTFYRLTASKEMDHETTKHRVDRSIFGPHLYYFPIDLCNPAGHGFRNVPI